MKKNVMWFAAVVGILCLATSAKPAHAAKVFFTMLNQGEEPPHPDPNVGTGSTATGVATFILNDAQTSLSYTIDIFGLDFAATHTPATTLDDISGLHFHGGAIGAQAGVVFGMISPQSDLDDRVISFPASKQVRVTGAWDGNEGNAGQTLASQLNNLLNGNIYLNAHTGAFSGGEIRGQVRQVGQNQGSPILPTAIGENGQMIFTDLPSGQWYDPINANQYNYQTTDGSNFTDVQLPLGLPDIDGMYSVNSSNGNFTVPAGAMHHFGSAVPTFSISGIDPSVDGSNPLAFPTFLAFDQPFASFMITPVPEPSAIALAALGLAGVIVGAWRRRNR